jgi:AcrR family transcriptional regulator
VHIDTRKYCGVSVHQKFRLVKGFSGTMQSMATASRNYGGVTAEQRRAIRRSALIEAALDLFTEDGARAVSKRAVCARARLNDRYFYEHFADADALLEAITRDLTAEGLEAVNAATDSVAPDIRAQVHATADAALAFLTADPRRGQLLLRSHTSEVLQRARLESTRAISTAMSAMLRQPLAASPASQLDTDMAAFAFVSGAMEVIAGWLRGDFNTTREHVADIVAGLLLAAADVSTALPGSASKAVQ